MATIYVFTGNTYPFRRLFRTCGGEFFYRPNRWEVPAQSNGMLHPDLHGLAGVECERITTVDVSTNGPVETAPVSAPVVNPTRTSSPYDGGATPIRRRRVSPPVVADDIGENSQEPTETLDNECPF